ncbi:MAG: tannase/feruloyl esterase family alpha/beta hydrolase [Solirubrobacterales bacterium]|nr:tannase/feruloyl esterase family alpha/beta hydrolase [Solirubrobacterales bacterium]
MAVDSATPVSGSFTAPGPPSPPLTGLPSLCSVTLTQLDSAGNPIHIFLWLPDNWNGRFQGVGGAGFLCGPLYSELADGVVAGYATAATDCGSQDPTGSFALNKAGALNTALIDDFAYTGIHDMTVDGKAVTQAYYGSGPRYAYFNGCSTGGREGLMEAQRFPTDYNGIVSAAPAINWTKFIPAEIWPELVMLQSNDFLPSCKETAFTDAVTVACGGVDGVIQDPGNCHWNPFDLVGTVTPCGTITATDAAVVEKIWDGPRSTSGQRLWYGLEPGASFAGLAGTSTSSNGTTTGVPFPIAVAWLGTWVQQNPNWDWHTLTYAEFDQLFQQSQNEFSSTIATDDPDLSQFRDHGGKIILWHGLADQLIFPQGTINYYQRVQEAMGGPRRTDSFARLFLAPGAQHCASAVGPAPGTPYAYPAVAMPLQNVVNWVEHGQAPDSILAVKIDPQTNVVTESRILCPYPETAVYDGQGNPNVSTSYRCTGSHRW